MSINRVTISGNLTRDPELRATQGGTSVLALGVAVNDRRKNPQTGAWEDYPNFVDCVVFGARGERLAQYLAKGSKVAVEGKLRYRSWTDQQTGKKRSALEVVVDDIDLMSAPGQQARAPQPPQAAPYARAPRAAAPAPAQAAYAPQAAPQQPRAYQQPAPQPAAPAQAAAYELYDEDIPF